MNDKLKPVFNMKKWMHFPLRLLFLYLQFHELPETGKVLSYDTHSGSADKREVVKVTRQCVKLV